MFIPLPRIILIPYRLIRLLLHLIFRKWGYSERDKQVLRWLAKHDDPLRPVDYQIKEVAQINAAIKVGRAVYLKYAGSDGFSSRRVIPERLFRRGNHIYVEGYCLKRKEYRRFRIDRIRYLL